MPTWRRQRPPGLGVIQFGLALTRIADCGASRSHWGRFETGACASGASGDRDWTGHRKYLVPASILRSPWSCYLELAAKLSVMKSAESKSKSRADAEMVRTGQR